MDIDQTIPDPDPIEDLLLCARGQTPEEASDRAREKAESKGNTVVDINVERGYGGHLACAAALPGVEMSEHFDGCRLTAKGVMTANLVSEYMLIHPYRVSANGVVSIPDVDSGPNTDPRSQKNDSKALGRRIAREAGWRRIGTGTTRDVYAAPDDHWRGDTSSDDCVVKIAAYSDYDGAANALEQTYKEVDIWEYEHDDAEGIVAPVGMWNSEYYGWSTQKQGISPPDISDADVSLFNDRIEKDGWRFLDWRRENMGEVGGEYVIIDSGSVYPPNKKAHNQRVRQERENARTHLRSQL